MISGIAWASELIEIAAQRFEAFERAFLVGAHQPRIADDISGQDRRQPSLDPLSAQNSLPAPTQASGAGDSISLTLRLGRKPINGAAGRLGPHAVRSCRISWGVRVTTQSTAPRAYPNGRFLVDATGRWRSVGARSYADVAFTWRHLVTYWSRIFPNRFEAVAVSGAEPFFTEIAFARAADPLRPRAAKAFEEFFFGRAREVYPRYDFASMGEDEFNAPLKLD
jgi:hypothetical protein